jgi:hypothetical protein
LRGRRHAITIGMGSKCRLAPSWIIIELPGRTNETTSD